MVFHVDNMYSLIFLGSTIILSVAWFVMKWWFNRNKKDKLSSKEMKIALSSSKVVNKIIKKEIIIKSDSKFYKKEELEKGKFYFEVKARDYFENLPFFKRWRIKRQFRRKRWKFILVRMNMLNNTVIEFFVPADANGFNFQKAHYIFDDTNKYWLTNSSIWCFDYHETIAIPVRVTEGLPNEVEKYLKEYEQNLRSNVDAQIDTDSIKRILEASQISAVKSALDPRALRVYLKSNFIQGLVAGASIGKIFRILLILNIIIVIVVAVNFIIGGYSSGIFENLVNTVQTETS